MTAAKTFLVSVNELKEAICNRNKSLILFCCDMINSLDFDQIPDDLLKEYDKLVSKSNNILSQIKGELKMKEEKKKIRQLVKKLAEFSDEQELIAKIRG